MHRIVGLMSGTSLDGVDACLARFWQDQGRVRFVVEAFRTYPFPEGLKAAVLEQMRPDSSRVDALAALNVRLGAWFADAVLRLLDEAGVPVLDVDLVGSHGQTLFHQPYGDAPSTLQLGDGAVIAVRTGLTTVHDFRPADMAAGGQGAPLVPYADRVLFAKSDRPVALLNLGGIANVTVLPPGGDGALLAFDVGPGNMVIDRFVERMTEGARAFDRDGAIAATGEIQPELLEAWLEHPFLLKAPPKSTGREAFGHAFADACYDEGVARGLSPEDLVATATAWTARGVAHALQAFVPDVLRPSEVIASGGGARNPQLMAHLRTALGPVRLSTLDDHGVSADAKEALAFALFAYQAARGLINHEPEATGANQALVLGKIAPGRNFGGIRLRPSAREASNSVTERPNPRSQGLDAMAVPEILALMNAEDERVLSAVAAAEPALSMLVAGVVAALRRGGRLFYMGAGTSGRLGVLDAAECPPTFSSDPRMVQGLIAGGETALLVAVEGAEDDRDLGRQDLEKRGLTERDVVVGIAASGRTPYVHGALAYAHAKGARTGLLTCNPMPRPDYVDTLVELVVGPEVLTGSTRLKAGTATKLALNMISTAAMVQLGKAYGNRMVDVKVSNQKLRARALRMVEELGRVDARTAERLLDGAAGKVKTAVVMARCGLEAPAAEARLEAAEGYLRRVIGDPAT